jgi:hypothetical protein
MWCSAVNFNSGIHALPGAANTPNKEQGFHYTKWLPLPSLQMHDQGQRC